MNNNAYLFPLLFPLLNSLKAVGVVHPCCTINLLVMSCTERQRRNGLMPQLPCSGVRKDSQLPVTAGGISVTLIGPARAGTCKWVSRHTHEGGDAGGRTHLKGAQFARTAATLHPTSRPVCLHLNGRFARCLLKHFTPRCPKHTCSCLVPCFSWGIVFVVSVTVIRPFQRKM